MSILEGFGLESLSWLELFCLVMICCRMIFKATENRNPTIPKAGIVSILAEDNRNNNLYRRVIYPKDSQSFTHVIVMCHGFFRSHSVFEKFSNSLSLKYPTAMIIIPDLIGFGSSISAASSCSLSLDLMVEQLEFLIRTVGQTKPVTLVGISMGGAVCMHASRILPLRGIIINKVVLIAPGGLENPPGNLLSLALKVYRLLYLHRFLSLLLTPLAPFFNKIGCLRRIPIFLSFSPTYNLDESCLKMNVPVYLVWGTNDTIHDYSLAKKFDKIEHCCLLTVPDGTHMSVCEHFENLHLEDFEEIWSNSKSCELVSQEISIAQTKKKYN